MSILGKKNLWSSFKCRIWIDCNHS